MDLRFIVIGKRISDLSSTSPVRLTQSDFQSHRGRLGRVHPTVSRSIAGEVLGTHYRNSGQGRRNPDGWPRCPR
jgi:hypothetical protein